MRRYDEAARLELGHDAAHGRRAHVDARLRRERLRRYRRTLREVMFDQHFQQALGALADDVIRSCGSLHVVRNAFTLSDTGP